MYLIIGLGNPGEKYLLNYHNLGFMTIDYLCDLLKVKLKKSECKSLTGEFFCGGEKVVLAKPQTYMNLSGEAVRELIGKYKPELCNVLVIYDDIDIDKGAVRYRQEGSAGTHNGMRNIIDVLGSTAFPRVRIGAGRPPEFVPLADYVLSDIPKEERPAMFEAIRQAAEKAVDLVKNAK